MEPLIKPATKPLSFEELDRERRYHHEDQIIERLDMIIKVLFILAEKKTS